MSLICTQSRKKYIVPIQQILLCSIGSRKARNTFKHDFMQLFVWIFFVCYQNKSLHAKSLICLPADKRRIKRRLRPKVVSPGSKIIAPFIFSFTPSPQQTLFETVLKSNTLILMYYLLVLLVLCVPAQRWKKKNKQFGVITYSKICFIFAFYYSAK